jgi:hypothetical protein
VPYWPAVLCPRPATLQHFPSHHARDMGCPPTPALPRLPFSLLPILRFALHRPAPSRARAGLGLCGLSLSGSGRLGVPVPSRLMPTRNPSPVTSLLGSGRLGLPAALRLGLTRIPASSHVTARRLQQLPPMRNLPICVQMLASAGLIACCSLLGYLTQFRASDS